MAEEEEVAIEGAVLALLQLEATAAEAYARALDEVGGDRVLRGSLVALRTDHERHLATLCALTGREAAPVPVTLPLPRSRLAALQDLLETEALIYAAYQHAEARGGLAPALALAVRAHRIDEARHLEFLAGAVELVEVSLCAA